MAVPMKRYMEIVSSKTQVPSGEPQLLFAPVADAGTQVHDEAALQQPEDEVGTFEQYLDHFPMRKARAGIDDGEGNDSENFLLRTSKPARISFEGNIGVGKSTILKLLQSHPRLEQVTEILQEPIWEWQNVKGTGLNMLEAFYKNPQRARSEEADVSLKYLQSLHSKHEKWFIESAFDSAADAYTIVGNWGGKSQGGYFSFSSKIPAVIRGRPIFVVDCSKTMEYDKPSNEVDRVVEEIMSFIKEPVFQRIM